MVKLIPYLAAVSILLSACAAPTISCIKIENPPFAERLAVGTEAAKDGPVTQKWLEQYTDVLEACGYGKT